MISKEQLLKEAKNYAYRPEILEKSYQLLAVLKQIMQIPYLRDRLVLKGGTALNLFHFKDIPRLSVDIDLNYIGQLERSDMLKERPLINDAIEQLLKQNKFEQYRNPNHHAGGKMVWRYSSVLGQKGNLEIDINYMYRRPLWPAQLQPPKLWIESNFKFPVLDIHELAAGKLSALFARNASRDLFDAYYLLTQCVLDNNKLRFAFVVYLSMTDIDPLSLSSEVIQYDELDIRNRLIPVFKQGNIPNTRSNINTWAKKLTQDLQEALNKILPLHESELNFMSTIQQAGIIDASMITDKPELQFIVERHPALLWVIQKNRKKT